jgi:DNA polymerase III delta subunit
MKSLEISQKFANDNNIFDGDENWKKRQDELHEFTDEHDLLGSIKLCGDSLYVELPQQLNEKSKEKFVNLLEFADDTLHCKHVIVYFDKTRSDRSALVKTFMFLGFHILSPNNTLITINDKQQDQLYLVYIIDSDE